MPSINIKEIDNTTAGRVAYSNFTVVVPGMCGTGKGSEGFDDNGVAELTTVQQFDNYIGYSTGGVVSKAPVFEEINPNGTDKYFGPLTLEKFAEYYIKHEVYIPVADATVTEVGYLKIIGQN